MTDKPYSEPLGGSYVVDKPGAKPVRVAFTEHHKHGAPSEAENDELIKKVETTVGTETAGGGEQLAVDADKPRKGK